MVQTKGNKPWFYILLLAIILLPPLIMYLFWFFKKEIPINIIIVDKTVPTKEKSEHASFKWLLNNVKIVKDDNVLYSIDDYYGFFPKDNEKYYISDFEKMDSSELHKTVQNNQMIYITDSYGVYANEWYNHEKISERSGIIYGGLTEKDIEVLSQFKKNKKLIITEFNCIGSPTEMPVRKKFEELFDLKWTGWVGRYFDNLSESNSDLPRWLIKNYKRQHNYIWEFKGSGIAFVNDNDQIEILEEGKDLKSKEPIIYTDKTVAKKYNIPEKISYPFWFDIMKINSNNIPISLYHINATARGDSIMKRNGILNTFPAIIEHYQKDYKFYYFAGDYADNNISKHLSHFSGVPYIKSIITSINEGDRGNFYWNYYYPLMTKILTEYNNEIQNPIK